MASADHAGDHLGQIAADTGGGGYPGQLALDQRLTAGIITRPSLISARHASRRLRVERVEREDQVVGVASEVAGLGADCVEKEMRDEHVTELRELLERGEADFDPTEFTRYGSARQLYSFQIDDAGDY